MRNTIRHRLRRLVVAAVAIVAAGALGVIGVGVVATDGNDWSPVAQKCPPEHEPPC